VSARSLGGWGAGERATPHRHSDGFDRRYIGEGDVGEHRYLGAEDRAKS